MLLRLVFLTLMLVAGIVFLFLVKRSASMKIPFSENYYFSVFYITLCFFVDGIFLKDSIFSLKFYASFFLMWIITLVFMQVFVEQVKEETKVFNTNGSSKNLKFSIKFRDFFFTANKIFCCLQIVFVLLLLITPFLF